MLTVRALGALVFRRPRGASPPFDPPRIDEPLLGRVGLGNRHRSSERPGVAKVSRPNAPGGKRRSAEKPVRPERSRTIPKEDAIELEGHVSQVLGNGNFKVEVNENHEVLAQIAGKMRKHRIRVLPGDRVRIEVSPYDLSRGRITYRFRS